MKPGSRVLAFPVAAALIAIGDGCQGITQADARVRRCRVDTLTTVDTEPNGLIVTTQIPPDDPARCRKAA